MASFNGGRSWSSIYNQLTGQFYRLATDNQFPYRVYGTQQDNSSLAVPSRTGTGAIGWNNCYAAGTGESGFIAPHPEDHNIVYLGAIGSSLVVAQPCKNMIIAQGKSNSSMSGPTAGAEPGKMINIASNGPPRLSLIRTIQT